MRILYFSINFPASENGESIYTDLAESISKEAEIDVFTFEKRKKTCIDYTRGFRTIRVKTINYFSSNIFIKFISLLTINIFAKHAIKKYSHNYYDLIIFEAPPNLLYKTCKWASKRVNAPIVLMQKDFFPENTVDLGMLRKNSLTYKFFRKQEKKCFEFSDFIGVMSEKNKTYLLENNKISKDKVFILPNSIKVEQNHNNGDYSKFDYFFNNKNIVVGVIGNLGKPQYIQLTLNSISRLSSFKNISFVLAGRGTEWPIIETFIKKNNLSNVLLVKNPSRYLSDFLTSKIDIGVVTISPFFKIPNFPSRILSYMKFSKPVVAATDSFTDFGYYIEHVYKNGLWCNSNDENEFCNNLIKLANNKGLRVTLGKNGNDYLKNNLDSDSVSKIILNKIIKNDELIIKNVKDSKIALKIADIHKRVFPQHFLTSLGSRFLKCFYSQYIKDSRSGIIGCFTNNNKLVSFLSYTQNNKTIVKRTIFLHPFSIALNIAFRFAFSSSFRKKMLSASTDVHEPKDMIYISSLGTDPNYQRKGCAKNIIHYLASVVKMHESFYILTDACNNDSVNDFYVRQGFVLLDSYYRSDGRKMNYFVLKNNR